MTEHRTPYQVAEDDDTLQTVLLFLRRMAIQFVLFVERLYPHKIKRPAGDKYGWADDDA